MARESSACQPGIAEPLLHLLAMQALRRLPGEHVEVNTERRIYITYFPAPSCSLQAHLIMAQATIFSKIVAGEIPADIVYATTSSLPFVTSALWPRSTYWSSPTRLSPRCSDAVPEDEPALGRMLRVAAKLAEQEGIAEAGYRVMINCRDHGGQEVYHLHLHILGGRPLGRMLAP